jgi:hypothetical protein
MLDILSPHWVLRCRTLAQKQALLDHAQAVGIPIGGPGSELATRFRNSGELDLGAIHGALISYPHDPAEDTPELAYWTEAQFRAASDRFARTAAHGNG